MKGKVIHFEYEIIRKDLVSKVSDEVIDLMRKKNGLTPLECGYLLENLLAALQDTMGCTFSVANEAKKGNQKIMEGDK